MACIPTRVSRTTSGEAAAKKRSEFRGRNQRRSATPYASALNAGSASLRTEPLVLGCETDGLAGLT
eukprot:15481175-Alexandrium_andersonii.AAC.1